MSYLGSIFDGASDEDVGTQLLSAYYNEAIKSPDFTYTTFDSWLTYLNSLVPDYASLIGGLVKGNSASTTIDQAQNRLMQLADASSGQASVSQITATAGGSGDTINYSAAIPEVALESATEAAQYAVQVAQDVGQGVSSTLSLVKYLPWILGGAAALYIFTMAKSQGKSVSKLFDAASERLKK